MSSVKAIIFDMDGVLVDSEDLWEEAEELFLSKYGHHWDRDRLKSAMVGTSALASTQFLKDELGLPGTIEELVEERLTRVDGMLAKHARWMKAAREFVVEVQKKYKTAVGTSSAHRSINAINSLLHLRELFGEHIYSVQDANNKSKPAPDVYLLAAQKIGVHPSECIVIEDAPKGIDAAHAAGMRCIAVTTTMGRDAVSHADWVVDSLDQVDFSWFG